MRGFLAFLFLGLVALGAGAIGYNIGVSQQVATTAAANGASVVYAGGWGHWGAGLWFFPFGLFLVPLFFFCFFGFLAFAFGPRRRWGHGAWFGPDGGPNGYGPMGRGFDPRREWIADAHRRLHEEEAARSASSPTSSTTTSSGTSGAPGTGGPTQSGGPSAG